MPEGFSDTSIEDRELQKSQSTKKRIRNLGLILVIALVARIFVKDPPPYKAPDHSGAQVKYLPGMLDAMPEEDRAKLSPEMLAKFREADDNARGRSPALDRDWALSQYVPEEAPLVIESVSEEDKELMFQYAKKRRRIEALREQIIEEPTRIMLVQFKTGGYIRATSTSKENNLTTIRIDNSLAMGVPTRLVRSIKEGQHNWKPPVPKGFTKLKPAKGITIIVANKTAQRLKKRFS